MARKPRRRRRTSIRTAAGTVQDQFIARMQALRSDPTQVLPIIIGDEPKPLALIRKKVEAMAAKGKGGFLDKRDKGVVGAVANALPLADLTAIPRIADRRIGGKRRFFLQRGQVQQLCSLGVQNFDDPIALLTAYRELAKSDGLHFFAGPKLWCTGTVPAPPEDWLHALTKCDLGREAENRVGCGHQDTDRILLGFRGGGPSIAICPDCAKPDKNLHGRIALRYAGPKVRQPVEVDYLASDGSIHALRNETVATYRAGATTERVLTAEGRTAWQSTRGRRYLLGGDDFGDDQEAFVRAAAGDDAWERDAVRAVTTEGHTDVASSVEDILQAHRDRIVEAWHAVTGSVAPPKRIPSHDLRGWLRRAHQDAARTRRMQRLPDPGAVGPVGRFLDHVARAHAADGPNVALHTARKGGGPLVPAWQVAAVMQALGGDLPQGLDADSAEAAKRWAEHLRDLLAAEGNDYVDALRRYLYETGTGEAAEPGSSS